MLSDFIKGLEETQQKEMKQSLLSGEIAFLKLIELLEEDTNACVKEMTDTSNYNGDWPYKQAELVASVKVNKKIVGRLKKVLDKVTSL